jgi:hypothetical protein
MIPRSPLPVVPDHGRFYVRLDDGTQAYIWLPEHSSDAFDFDKANFAENTVRNVALMQDSGLIAEIRFNRGLWKLVDIKSRYGAANSRMVPKDVKDWLAACTNPLMNDSSSNPDTWLFQVEVTEKVGGDPETRKQQFASLGRIVMNWDLVLKQLRPLQLVEGQDNLDEARDIVNTYSVQAKQRRVQYYAAEAWERAGHIAVLHPTKFSSPEDALLHYPRAIIQPYSNGSDVGEYWFEVNGGLCSFAAGDNFWRIVALHQNGKDVRDMLARDWDTTLYRGTDRETTTKVTMADLVRHFLSCDPALFLHLDGWLPLSQWARYTPMEAAEIKQQARAYLVKAQKVLAIAKAAAM